MRDKRWMGVAVLVALVLVSAVFVKNAVVQAGGPMTTLVAAAPAPPSDSIEKHGPPYPWKTNASPATDKHGPPYPWKSSPAQEKHGPPYPWNR